MKDGTPRTLSGIVFEDATNKKKEDINNTAIEDGQYTRLGDGTYTEDRDKLIEGVLIQLMDKEGESLAAYSDGDNYSGVVELETEQNGKYTIKGFIPSNKYVLKFTYGNGETEIYNAQDYKSTIDVTGEDYTAPGENDISPDGEENYWYRHTTIYDKSVAKDDDTKMNTSTLNYTTAVNLEDYESVTDPGDKDIFENTATTQRFCVPIRNNGNKNSNAESYDIPHMNLGLAERPRSELTINKEVDHINITSTDGTTLIDGTQGAKNISWTDRYVQPIVDENLIYGSTITITYKIVITNTGEVDYKSENRRFYDYGVKEGNVITTKPDIVIDYVDNNLVYDDNTSLYNEADATNKKYWKKVTDDEIAELLDDTIESNVAKVNCKIKALNDSPLVNKALKPGESNQVYLALTKTLSDANNEDLLKYNNYVEILQSTNTAGRRSYHTTEALNDYVKDKVTLIGNYNELLLSDVENRGAPVDMIRENREKFLVLSIPGDFDPVELELSTLYWEPDTDCAEEVQVIQPFGDEKNYNITIFVIIGTISAIILAGGIYIIKKKVLDK